MSFLFIIFAEAVANMTLGQYVYRPGTIVLKLLS